MEDCIKEIQVELKEMSKHITILNDEQGQLRDYQRVHNTAFQEFKKDFYDLKSTVITVVNDVSWLKRFFFIIATSSIGALVVGVINLIASR